MSVAIIQGASGGQGLALTAHILKHTFLRVYALTHGKGDSIRSSLEKSDRLTVIDGVDVREERALEDAANTVKEREGKAAVRLIACLGGVVCLDIPLTGSVLTCQLTPEKSLGGIKGSDSLAQFQINAIGHLLTYKHFVPLLPSKKEWHDVASWKNAEDDPARGLVSPSNSLCWSQSARVGSIADNEKGGWYSYRASKAALNQLIRTLAIEDRRRNERGIVVALHPGTVDTNLSRPFQQSGRDLFKPDRAAVQLLDVIDGLKPQDSGKLFAWDGTEIAP